MFLVRTRSVVLNVTTETELLEGLARADLESKLRLKLLQKLIGVSTPASLPALRTSLASRDRRIRVAAVFGLGHVGTGSAVDAILETFGAGDGLTAAWAANTLGNMRAVKAIPVIVEYLDRQGTNMSADDKTMMILALSSMPDPRAVDVLRAGAVDRHRMTRKAAARALAVIGTVESRDALKWASARQPGRRGRSARAMLSRTRR